MRPAGRSNITSTAAGEFSTSPWDLVRAIAEVEKAVESSDLTALQEVHDLAVAAAGILERVVFDATRWALQETADD